MPAITQLVSNFIGGVSSQPDEKKLPGQVREIDNGYCDATFGLTKRPGMQWITTLASYTEEEDQLKNANWFFINRNQFEVYFGCITKDQNIKIWNAFTREEAKVYGPNVTIDSETCKITGGTLLKDEPLTGSVREYLKLEYKPGELEDEVVNPLYPHNNFDTLTVLAQTFLVNKRKIVKERPSEPYELKRRATVKIKSVEDLQDYKIKISLVSDPGTKYEAKFKTIKLAITDEINEDGEVTQAQTPTNADNILSNLRKVVEEGDPDGRGSEDNVGILDLDIPGATFKVIKFETSLEIEADVAFNIDVEAGRGGNALEVYQDEVGNSSRLSESSVDGRLVKIINTASDDAAYFAKFVANDPTDEDAVSAPGTGYWQQDLGWAEYPITNENGCEEKDEDNKIKTEIKLTSPGLVDSTMPHALKNLEPDVFVFEEVQYTDRLVGDPRTNSKPTFVDNYINAIFLYANRLGLLSAENVIMSQAGEFENFYFTDARIVIDSDPIDLNCSSIRPANLFAVIPQTQGLILFSSNEQFNMYSDGDALTPSNTVIRSISNYEASPDITPVDIGTSIVFISTNSAYTRTLAMSTRGQDNSPIIVDIGKVASEYVPKDIDFLSSSSQNSFITITSQDKKEVYFYRFFNNGEKDLMQAWFKWIVPGNIQSFIVINDQIFSIIKDNGEYLLVGAALNQSPTAGMAALPTVNPKIDLFYCPNTLPKKYWLYKDPEDSEKDNPIAYDPVTDISTLPRPYNSSADFDPIVVEVPQIKSFGSGPMKISEVPMQFQDVNLSSEELDVGYLPTVIVDGDGNWTLRGNWQDKKDKILVGIRYVMSVELPTTFYKRENISDYTANLTISRYKFSFGDTGFVEFKSKALGSDEWNKLEPVPDADYYNADSAPFTPETIITVPIHQKNKYFNFKIESDTPAPVSINSMMWEGQYYPRFYKRV